MFERLKCMAGGHQPNKRKVVLIDDHYHGHCRRCGARLKRLKRDHWVALWPWQKGIR